MKVTRRSDNGKSGHLLISVPASRVAEVEAALTFLEEQRQQRGSQVVMDLIVRAACAMDGDRHRRKGNGDGRPAAKHWTRVAVTDAPTPFKGRDVRACDSPRHVPIRVAGRSQDMVASGARLAVQTAVARTHAQGWRLPHARCGTGKQHHEESARDGPRCRFSLDHLRELNPIERIDLPRRLLAQHAGHDLLIGGSLRDGTTPSRRRLPPPHGPKPVDLLLTSSSVMRPPVARVAMRVTAALRSRKLPLQVPPARGEGEEARRGPRG